MTDIEKPLLVYDGDCQFCSYWVRYWRRISNDKIRFEPYQEIAGQFSNIPIEDFQKSIQLFDGDQRYQGADAASRVLLAAGHGLFHRLYQKLPFLAVICEWFYTYISQHRSLAMAVSRLLWGSERHPEKFVLTSWLFLRLIGLVYLAAFWSFGVQVIGLVGADGILPLQNYLAAISREYGADRYWLVPIVFWIDASDRALELVCIGGALASVLVALNRLVQPMLVACFVLYLSLVYAGQEFMHFQWDLFLLEAGFLAILLPTGSRMVVWLYRWLLFRFMFMSGIVKLLSGDMSWTNLTAIQYHYETQPLPSPLAWYFHHLPTWFHQFSTGATLFIELMIPFLFFAPKYPRVVAALLTLMLQVMILLSGNYNFFNILTIILCLFLLDDHTIRKWIPAMIVHRIKQPGLRFISSRVIVACLAAWIVLVSAIQMVAKISGNQPQGFWQAIARSTSTLNITNVYGPFSVMTKTRPEIIVQGSNDGRSWRAYRFHYKPLELDRRPGWNIPHQPRLDWQMWFAAYSDPRYEIWFQRFMQKLHEGSPAVLSLLDENPFPDDPPRYVRAMLYRYTFTSPDEHQRNGQWWNRIGMGRYL